MAELSKDGASLRVKLSAAEKAEALRGDIELPLSCIREIEVLDDAIHDIHGLAPSGFKMVGSYLPGRLAVGTFFAGMHTKKTFAAVHHDTPRGLRIRLDDADFGTLIIGCEGPEDIKTQLQPGTPDPKPCEGGPDAAHVAH